MYRNIKVRRRILEIFRVFLTACAAKAKATPSPAPLSTNTPLSTATSEPIQTSEPTPIQIGHVDKTLIDSCPQSVDALQLIDARVSDSGVLEVIYNPIQSGYSEEEERNGLMFNSPRSALRSWNEDTQKEMLYPQFQPSDALGVDVSTDQLWMVFRRDIEEYEKSELWVTDINGQNERKLATISLDEIKTRHSDRNVKYARWGYGWVPNTDKVYYYVLAGDLYDSFSLVDIPSGMVVPILQARESDKFIFAPDGATIAFLTASQSPQTDNYGSQPAALLKGSNLRLVNTNDASTQFTLPFQIRNDLLDFSPDGKYAIGFSYDGIVRMNVKDGTWQKIPLNYTTVSETLPEFTWVGNSTMLIPMTNLSEGVRDINENDLLVDPNANFSIWRVNINDASVQPLQTFSGIPTSVEFSPDGHYLTFRKNIRQAKGPGDGKFIAFRQATVKMGGRPPISPDLTLADLNTGNILATLEASNFLAWSPYADRYVYDQIGETVNGIHLWGIFLGQVGEDPIFIKLEMGSPSLFRPAGLRGAKWVDPERFVMDMGCEISLVSLIH
jgi:Tol biopolymer transport system component